MGITKENLYIERILNGETGLYSYFLERYSRPIFSLVIQMVSCEEDAEEITQDIFLKAFNRLNNYRGDSSFSTWLFRIAYNMAIDFCRKKKQQYLYIEENAINNVPDTMADEILYGTSNEQLEKLTHAIELLNAEEKALITLFYYEQKSIEETAHITKLSVANVKVRLYRTRKKLYILLNTGNDGRKC